eukprot:scaffold113045_cov17-Tisochrysis_lutea.AAC.1
MTWACSARTCCKSTPDVEETCKQQAASEENRGWFCPLHLLPSSTTFQHLPLPSYYCPTKP